MEDKLRAAGVELNDISASGDNAAKGIDATSRSASQAQKRLKALEDQAGITALKLNQLRIVENEGKQRELESKSNDSNFFRATAGGEGFGGAAQATLDKNNNAELGQLRRENDLLRRQTNNICSRWPCWYFNK